MKTKKIHSKSDITIKQINALIDEVNELRHDKATLGFLSDDIAHWMFVMAQAKETDALLVEHLKAMLSDISEATIKTHWAYVAFKTRWHR